MTDLDDMDGIESGDALQSIEERMRYDLGEELFKLCCYRNPFFAISFLTDLHLRFDDRERNAIINYIKTSKRNTTPLLAACEWSTPEVVELLLYYGANVHHRDIYGSSCVGATMRRVCDLGRMPCGEANPTHLRVYLDATRRILQLLYLYGACSLTDDAELVDLGHVFKSSVKMDNLFSQIIPWMMDIAPEMMNPNVEEDGLSLLAAAVGQRKVHYVTMCLNLGADLHWRHADGRTLLHFACQQSANSQVIAALLQRLGTTEAIAEALSAVDERGQTVVHVAAQNIVCDNLKYLVEQYQADLTALDKNGRNALMYAVLAAGNYPRDSEFRAHLGHFHSDDNGSTSVDNPLTLCYLLYHPRTCVTLNINEVDQFGQSVLLLCVTTLAQLLRDRVNMPSTLVPLETPPTMDPTEFLQVDPALYYAESDHLRPHTLMEDGTGGESNGQRVHIYNRVHLQCWILYRLLHASHWHAQRDAADIGCDGSPSRVIRWAHDDVNARTFLAHHDVVISVFLDWVSKTNTATNSGTHAATTTVDTAWIPNDWQSIAAVSRAHFSSPPRPPQDDQSTTRKGSRCCLS